MSQVTATPINGARVRKPDGHVLKVEGEPVERDSFWLRRQNDGDVRLDPLSVDAQAADDEAANVTPIKPKK